MPYPRATDADAAFFQQHGWIAVTDAIDPVDLEEVIRRCNEILANKETMAYDWAWQKGTSLEERDFKIVQSSPTKFWPELNRSRFRRWAIEFGSDLMGEPIEFWVRPVPRQAARARSGDALAPGRGVLGTQPRRSRHDLLDAVSQRGRTQRLHALHQRWPPGWDSRSLPPRQRAERPPVLPAR